MNGKVAFLEALTSISSRGFEKLKGDLRRNCYKYNIACLDNIKDYINESLPRYLQYDDIIPEVGFASVDSFERTIETLYYRGLVKGLSLKYVKTGCDALRRVETRASVVEDSEYKAFLRAVIKGTMKISMHMLLINIGDQVSIQRYIARSFKICYSLFRSNLPYDCIYYDSNKTWMKIFVIVGNAVLKKRSNRSAIYLNQVRSLVDVMKYMQADTYTEIEEHMINMILKVSTSIMNADFLDEYKDYITISWEEFCRYKDDPNMY